MQAISDDFHKKEFEADGKTLAIIVKINTNWKPSMEELGICDIFIKLENMEKGKNIKKVSWKDAIEWIENEKCNTNDCKEYKEWLDTIKQLQGITVKDGQTPSQFYVSEF